MSHQHFPIISTTPPPIDEDDDDLNIDDEDNDFGTFTGVLNEDDDGNDIPNLKSIEKKCQTQENLMKNTEKLYPNECDDFTVDDDNQQNRNDEGNDKVKESIYVNDKECDGHDIASLKITNHCDNSVESDSNSLNLPEYGDSNDGPSFELPDSVNERNDGDDNDDVSGLSANDTFPEIDNVDDDEDDDYHDDHDDGDDFADFENHFGKSQNPIESCEKQNIPNEESESSNELRTLPVADDHKFINDVNINDNREINCDLEFADFSSFHSFVNESVNDENEITKRNETNERLNNEFKFNDNQPLNNTGANGSTFIDEDDDFADFETAAVSSEQNNVNFTNKSNLSHDDSEFADFASFDANQSVTINYHKDLSPHDTNKIDLLVGDTFSTEITLPENDNSAIISRDLFLNADPNSSALWKNVQNLEDALSLKLRWPNSHAFQLLLNSLKIDPRNILRNSSVPIFASGLGLLEPTKGPLNDMTENHNDSAPPESDHNPSVIPPVQFDWNMSGLINPLEVNRNSSVFDLDFFVTNDDISKQNQTNGNSSFDEFIKSDTNSHINTNTVESSESSNIFQQLLSNIKSIKNASTVNDPSLSTEALQVLDELPNLSFMRAKVLMFPIKNDS